MARLVRIILVVFLWYLVAQKGLSRQEIIAGPFIEKEDCEALRDWIVWNYKPPISVTLLCVEIGKH